MTAHGNSLEPHQIELLKELIEGGVPGAFITCKFGWSQPTIRKYKKELGLPSRCPTVPLRDRDLTLYVDGIIREVRRRHNPWKRP